MPAASDPKLALVAELGICTQGAKHKDSCRNMLCQRGLYYAIGNDRLFLGRPKRGSGADISDRDRVDDFRTQDVRKSGALDDRESSMMELGSSQTTYTSAPRPTFGMGDDIIQRRKTSWSGYR